MVHRLDPILLQTFCPCVLFRVEQVCYSVCFSVCRSVQARQLDVMVVKSVVEQLNCSMHQARAVQAAEDLLGIKSSPVKLSFVRVSLAALNA